MRTLESRPYTVWANHLAHQPLWSGNFTGQPKRTILPRRRVPLTTIAPAWISGINIVSRKIVCQGPTQHDSGGMVMLAWRYGNAEGEAHELLSRHASRSWIASAQSMAGQSSRRWPRSRWHICTTCSGRRAIAAACLPVLIAPGSIGEIRPIP